jgi:hypothetical protein
VRVEENKYVAAGILRAERLGGRYASPLTIPENADVGESTRHSFH